MTKTEDMLPAFDKFVAKIDESYALVRQLLATGRYNEAYTMLARINGVHARTSVSLRSVCIRRGLMKDDE